MNLIKKFLVIFILSLFLVPTFSFASTIATDTKNNRVYSIETIPKSVLEFAQSCEEYKSLDDNNKLFIYRTGLENYKVVFASKNSYSKIHTATSTGRFASSKYFNDANYYDLKVVDNIIISFSDVAVNGYCFGNHGFLSFYYESLDDGSFAIWLYSTDNIYTGVNNDEIFYEGIVESFSPILENLYFVETLDGYFLQTDKLNYDDYIDYDMFLYNEDNNLWSKDNVIKEFVSDYYFDENGTAIYTTAIQFKYKISISGSFTFRLQHNSQDIVSNSYTYTVTDFNIAYRLIYDIYEPIYFIDYQSGNAIVYTNYLDVKYYDSLFLYYYDESDQYDNFCIFSNSVISKEYNIDKTQFRFKLKFSEPCSYSCRYVVSNFAEYGLYYSDVSSFTITQEFFDNKGYEEQGILSRIGDFFKDFFVGIFVPKEGYVENKISYLGDKLNVKIPYQQYIKDFEQLSKVEAESKDIVVGADLGEYKVTDGLTIEKKNFLDFSIFTKYQEVWFSWVRVVFYVGLIIFNINMLMKFLRGFSVSDGQFFVATSKSNK